MLIKLSGFDNYFLQAQRLRGIIRNDFNRVFRAKNVLSSPAEADDITPLDGVDLLIHPTSIGPAMRLLDDASPLPSPVLGKLSEPARHQTSRSLDAYVQDTLSVPSSLAGIPALNIPMYRSGMDWPMGITILGQWGYDRLLLAVAQILETARAGQV